MRKTNFFAALMAVVAWTGCQNTLEIDDPSAPGNNPVAVRDSMTLTIEAGKSFDTKALGLVNAGQRLNAFWSAGEVVNVFAHGLSDPIGTLTVTPKEDNTKATLSGSISTTGLAANQTLTLLFPKAVWSYEGQIGTLESIASDFDFARAQVTIEEITSERIKTTNSTTFENLQSIYRFGFHHNTSGTPTIRTKTVLLTSNQGKLVKSVNLANGTETKYGTSEPMTVELTTALTAEQAAADALIYIAIRNGNTTANDTFSFTIYDNDGATYKGTQVIPQANLASPFVSAKNVSLDRLELTQGATSVATAL